MPIIGLILSAAEAAYQHFVGIPDAERRTRENQERLQREYDKQLADYKAYLKSPVVGIPKEAIELAMQGVKQSIQEEQARLRTQTLEDLAARGVRASGVSEYPLGKIREAGQKTIAQARRDMEIQSLMEEAKQRQQRELAYQSLLGGGISRLEQPLAEANTALLQTPSYRDAMLSQLARLGGYALSQPEIGGPVDRALGLTPGVKTAGAPMEWDSSYAMSPSERASRGIYLEALQPQTPVGVRPTGYTAELGY